MLDEQTADRILSGLVAPADAPPGYAEVTRLILGLRQPPLRPAPAGEPGRLRIAPARWRGSGRAHLVAVLAVAVAVLALMAARRWPARAG